jgi:glycosyltransferase involved in cell wall biosynthesis
MKKLDEKVSVIIPSYNSAKFLPETLKSVFDQTYKNIEIILIDDGSTDETLSVIRPYKNMLKYVFIENSGGPAKPRNIGVSMAASAYISSLDSDDRFYPSKIEHSLRLLNERPEIGLVFNNFEKKCPNKEMATKLHIRKDSIIWKLALHEVYENSYIIPKEKAFVGLLQNNFIGTSGVVTRKKVLTKIGGFDENVTTGGLEDRDMWLRISKNYDIGYIDKVLHAYEIRKNSVSRRSLAAAKAKIEVIKKYLNCGKNKQVKKVLNQNLGKWYPDLGQQYRFLGSTTNSVKYYAISFLKNPDLRPLKGIVKTLTKIV